jgi:hypothetical protein
VAVEDPFPAREVVYVHHLHPVRRAVFSSVSAREAVILSSAPVGPFCIWLFRRSCRVCPSAIQPRGFNTVTAAVTTSSLMGGET